MIDDAKVAAAARRFVAARVEAKAKAEERNRMRCTREFDPESPSYDDCWISLRLESKSTWCSNCRRRWSLHREVVGAARRRGAALRALLAVAKAQQ